MRLKKGDATLFSFSATLSGDIATSYPQSFPIAEQTSPSHRADFFSGSYGPPWKPILAFVPRLRYGDRVAARKQHRIPASIRTQERGNEKSLPGPSCIDRVHRKISSDRF